MPNRRSLKSDLKSSLQNLNFICAARFCRQTKNSCSTFTAPNFDIEAKRRKKRDKLFFLANLFHLIIIRFFNVKFSIFQHQAIFCRTSRSYRDRFVHPKLSVDDEFFLGFCMLPSKIENMACSSHPWQKKFLAGHRQTWLQ